MKSNFAAWLNEIIFTKFPILKTPKLIAHGAVRQLRVENPSEARDTRSRDGSVAFALLFIEERLAKSEENGNSSHALRKKK